MLPGSLSITAHSEDKIFHTFTVGLFIRQRFNGGYLASELVLIIRNKLCKQPAHMKALNLIQSATCGYTLVFRIRIYCAMDEFELFQR